MPSNTYNVKQRSYATSRFAVQIDGQDITAFVKNVEGGLVKTDAVEEKAGVANFPQKHAGTRSVEPLTLDIGMCRNSWVLEKVSTCINSKKHERFSGQIDYVDANYGARFTHQFTRALITEIGFPTFDPTAKDAAYIKLKLQPETADFDVASGGKIQTTSFAEQKLWQPNAFYLEIERGGDKIDCSKVTKIEAMTVKVGTKPGPQGPRQLPAYLPTTVQMPKLSIHLPLHGAESAIKWYREAVAATQSLKSDSTGYEATGALVLLDASRKEELYRITFDGLGPELVTIVKGEGGSTNLKTCKLDMYVTSMKLGS
ncbi:MAG: phage tail protein [Kofleriaceae bacterium]|jgi:hypothetical protein|nr:phage tail protein [Kofleriaceae bacterium]MBP9170792.1 phage tail protein [Kofleriaceae bacterium]MBP9857693.1 phage tail protein [Kofleriaceae bacterium]